jgi:hypothetical protein
MLSFQYWTLLLEFGVIPNQ